MKGFILDASRHTDLNMDDDYDPYMEEDEDEEPAERTFHFPAEMIKEMTERYGKVVVRDFGDEYHMSEEDRLKQFELYDLFRPIERHRTKYTKIVDYVRVMRECYKFIVGMAKKNRLIMDPEEFIVRALKGEIEIARLSFPQYKGKDRKDLNWKMVAEYIRDDSLDASELNPKQSMDYIPLDDLENPEENLHKYFTPEQINIIFGDTYEPASTTRPYDEDVDINVNEMQVARVMSKKETKKFFQAFPDAIRPLKEFRANRDVENGLKDFAFELDSTAYEYISKLDEKRGFMRADQRPKFTGDIMNSRDVKKYLYQLDEFEENHTMVAVNGRYMTLAEKKETDLKDELDRVGWNVMTIYSNKEKQKKQEEAEKRDKKKEKRLRKRLSDLKNRRKMRESNDSSKWETPKKKHKKSSKKKADAFGKVAAYSGTGGRTNDFEEYEKQMLDMSWGK